VPGGGSCSNAGTAVDAPSTTTAEKAPAVLLAADLGAGRKNTTSAPAGVRPGPAGVRESIFMLFLLGRTAPPAAAPESKAGPGELYRGTMGSASVPQTLTHRVGMWSVMPSRVLRVPEPGFSRVKTKGALGAPFLWSVKARVRAHAAPSKASKPTSGHEASIFSAPNRVL